MGWKQQDKVEYISMTAWTGVTGGIGYYPGIKRLSRRECQGFEELPASIHTLVCM